MFFLYFRCTYSNIFFKQNFVETTSELCVFCLLFYAWMSCVIGYSTISLVFNLFVCQIQSLPDTVARFTTMNYTTEELSGSEDGSHIFEVFTFHKVSGFGIFL